MNAVMYLFLNRGLGMSTGKASAQVAHAAVEAVKISKDSLLDQWYLGNHYTKLVMLAENTLEMLNIERYLKDRGFRTAIIIDEGRTEIPAFSPTALGVEIVDKDDLHTAFTFEHFKLYKDPKIVDLKIAYNTVGAHGHLNRKGKKELEEIRRTPSK